MWISSQFLQCLAVVVLVLATGCSSPNRTAATQTQPITVGLAPTDQAGDWAAEHARVRERNRKLPAFTIEELHKLMAEPANNNVLRLWRETRSYYALLEIIEGIIEP